MQIILQCIMHCSRKKYQLYFLKFIKVIAFVALNAYPTFFYAQSATIRVVKQRQFLFYHLGNTDTLKTNQAQFVLLLANNKITPLEIQMVNGYIHPIGNDTLYEFTYVPGYNYSCGFKCDVFTTERACEWQNGVNGVHENDKKKIIIRIYQQGEKIIENVFWMR